MQLRLKEVFVKNITFTLVRHFSLVFFWFFFVFSISLLHLDALFQSRNSGGVFDSFDLICTSHFLSAVHTLYLSLKLT